MQSLNFIAACEAALLFSSSAIPIILLKKFYVGKNVFCACLCLFNQNEVAKAESEKW